MSRKRKEVTIQSEERGYSFSDEQLEALFFVAKATARPDEPLRSLEFICVQPNRVMATDGHRLHYVDIEMQLPTGLYRIEKKTKKKLSLTKMKGMAIKEWPDVNKLIDNTVNSYSEFWPFVGDYAGCYPSLSYSDLVRRLPGDRTISFDFFKECTAHADEYSVGKQDDDNTTPIWLRSLDQKFNVIIMPLKM